MVLQIDLGLLAQLQIGVSSSVRVDGIKALYFGCSRTIVYFAYIDYFHCDALCFGRLRRLYFRCTARLVV